MEEINDELLWAYIDGSISQKDRENLEWQFLSNDAVADRLALLTAFHKEIRKEIRPDLLDPLAATHMRFNVLKGLDLDAKKISVLEKRDNVIAGVFISLLIFFCGALVIYFFTGGFIAATLSQHNEFFILPIVAVVLLAGLFFNGYLSYQRTIRSMDTS